ncbi:hypothetical protein EMIT0P201_50251 [Pseudomonas chlororaphis]
MVSIYLSFSLLVDDTSQASWHSNSALVDTKPVLLSLAALSPKGCGGSKEVLQVFQV